jgi:hypothetical protein
MEERDRWGVIGIGTRIILKWLLRKFYVGWSYVAVDIEQ